MVVVAAGAGIVQRRRSETLKTEGVRYPEIHGVVYDIHTGLLKEMPVNYAALRRYDNIYKLY